MATDAHGRTLRLLLDTNIVIAHEDDSAITPHVNADAAASLIRNARDLGFELVVSYGTKRDILRAPEPLRSERTRTLDKYYTQLEPVADDAAVREFFPDDLGPNDRADLEVLSTFAAGVATVLVTEDGKMRNRAARAGLGNVFALDDAVEWLRTLQSPTLTNAAAAVMPGAYQIRRDAYIFDSLHADYGDYFKTWWAKVVDERRPVIVLGDAQDPQGLAVLKEEANSFDLGDRILKICTFKVDDGYGRSRRGELLLRAVVDYAVERHYPVAYLTAWPHHEKLLGWLTSFGFEHLAETDEGEIVMVKRFRPADPTAPPLAPLDHHVAYGPRALRVDRAFIVPIQDKFHGRLFPDSDDQGTLLDNEACGNAIRKAYLCRSNSRLLRPGDTLIFVRTSIGEARATSVGVVEETRVSQHPEQLAAFVAGRTVYSYDEMVDLCEREVLAIRFRLDRRIEPAWPASTLVRHKVMVKTPMSVTRVPEEGAAWVRAELDG